MSMYEARLNKEKVSRTIGSSGNGVWQKLKIGKANIQTIAQFISDTIEKSKNKKCIQLLEIQEDALRFDFITKDRREKYFSTANIEFFNNHIHQGIGLNTKDGELITRDKKQKQKIIFLPHPLRDMMPKKGINTVALNEKLKWRIGNSIYSDGYMSNTYTRKSGTDSFEESLEQQLLKYNEVMFITKGTTMYLAPNGKDNIQLSHPSLLGGYPYEVDDAGTLEIHNDRIEAMEDSGHYGKRGGRINTEITNMLTVPADMTSAGHRVTRSGRLFSRVF